ncbi:MAG: hypothetical protein ABS99_01290 [Acetobacteraceae bacterium SCN 69-10]|nr:MAG: hypothetical protein ABS99_01290 [Acetobacteraceae bacterium SCN 69-10]
MPRHLPSLPHHALVLVVLLLLAAPRAWAGGGFDDAARVARLLPSVVAIDTTTLPSAEPGKPKPPPVIDHASGFVIDSSGVILTSGHVADGKGAIRVVLQDGTVLAARVLFRAPVDLAMLKVEAGRLLPAVQWGDSDRLRPGDGVVAIGNPLGIGISVSAGIVSALGRDIHATPFDDFIQTDAALNKGNSGGPLFNLKGEVIGVATGLITPKGVSGSIGLGLAIPGNDAQFMVDSFNRFGRVRSGWLGAQVAAVTPGIADSLELPQQHGAVVTGVLPGGPAAKAGLQVGDVILRAGSQAVTGPHMLARRFATATVGDSLHLTLLRAATPAAVDVVVGEAPEPAGKAAAPPTIKPRPDLGLSLAPLDAAARRQYGIPATLHGVLVAAVAPDSVAAEHGLAAGDVIARTQWSAVERPEDVEAGIESARGTGRGHVMLAVQGPSGARLLALPLAGG